MSLYHQSTHLKYWIFSRPTLGKLRAVANRLSLQKGESGRTNEPCCFAADVGLGDADLDELLVEAGISGGDTDTGSRKRKLGDESSSGGAAEALTMEDETLLKRYYEEMLLKSCDDAGGVLRVSHKVKATAILLFKRFYLSNSIMEFDPKIFLLTALYLGGKVEEETIPAEAIGKAFNVDDSLILESEPRLLQGLHFHLIVYHPFRSLLGFVEDARLERERARAGALKTLKARPTTDTAAAAAAAPPPPPLELNGLTKLVERSFQIILASLTSDCCLLFSPAVVSVAVLRLAVTELQQGQKEGGGGGGSSPYLVDIDAYLRTRFGGGTAEHSSETEKNEEQKEEQKQEQKQEQEDLSMVWDKVAEAEAELRASLERYSKMMTGDPSYMEPYKIIDKKLRKLKKGGKSSGGDKKPKKKARRTKPPKEEGGAP